ncbi:hypothetical protein XA68_11107 [Ophiocordyceps unilateralis]|uniref:RING-type domain-containing protein n=1 Tax=Ophiocordyceps unilateralis TaxID=268505 RepID=A0A2A9P2A3_OPHUN|nr:hypothetical protein XA68_11107 [Ophiocordyceps unilateralis]
MQNKLATHIGRVEKDYLPSNMEHVLACNNLKCRKELRDRALVTLCSHVFCLECAQGFELVTRKQQGNARCLACLCILAKPEDAVIRNLKPTEEYKSSALSGLPPNIIMECAGRALGFWAYQTTQEISYQEFLYNTLMEKYSSLRVQLEQMTDDANVEIERLRHRLSTSATEHDMICRKNEKLVQAYKEKSRKLLQTQQLYNNLQRKAVMTNIQRATYDAIESKFRMSTLIQPAAGGCNKYHTEREREFPTVSAISSRGSTQHR